jgi:hypothetical protein
MTDDKSTKAQGIAPPKPTPDLAWKRMARLVGAWKMQGGPVGSDTDTMTGTFTFKWLYEENGLGLFLQQDMEMDYDGTLVKGREIISYDPKTDKFPSHVYSNMSAEALPYEWDVRGDDVTITVNYGAISSTYHGKFTPDGNSFSGGWRPNPGADENINPAYNDVATRIQ